MPSPRLSRRRLLASAAGATVAGSLAGCGSLLAPRVQLATVRVANFLTDPQRVTVRIDRTGTPVYDRTVRVPPRVDSTTAGTAAIECTWDSSVTDVFRLRVRWPATGERAELTTETAGADACQWVTIQLDTGPLLIATWQDCDDFDVDAFDPFCPDEAK